MGPELLSSINLTLVILVFGYEMNNVIQTNLTLVILVFG